MAWLLLLSTLAAPPLVAIDAGHGGSQRGAVGVCGVLEKDVTLSVSKELAAVLEASGRAQPMMTRESDVDLELEDRTRRANQAGAALFVSIHANSSPEAHSRGVETYFLSLRAPSQRQRDLVLRENEGHAAPVGTSEPLAAILDDLRNNAGHKGSQSLAMRAHLALRDRLEARGRGVMQAPFLVLRGAAMPAVLVEIGFLTHTEECRRLIDPAYQRSVAQALAGAILAELESARLAAAHTTRSP